MTNDLTHLNALQSRLFREEQRLTAARNPAERRFREQQIASVKREIDGERRFLGLLAEDESSFDDMSDDELLKELLS